MRTPSVLSLGLLLSPLALTGCVLNSTTASTEVVPAAIHGQVHGGQQPIFGSQVYLLAANTTGYGNQSLSLLQSGDGSSALGIYVSSAPDGSFSIGGLYACTPGQQVYLYALGGSPGGGTNGDIGLLAILGNCPAAGNFATATPYVTVNEATTIAAAYAFAGYAVDATHVSSSGTALAQTGIANAFATAGNLVTLSTGVALTTTPGSTTNNTGTVPQTEINTLANILAYCVNSIPSLASNCSTLFADAMNGSTTPTDTASAAINIAHNTAANVTALYDLQSGLVPFQPALTGAPYDWTVALYFTDGAADGPGDLAFDSSGNVWYVWTSNSSTYPSGVNELSPLGVTLSGPTGYTNTTYLPNASGIAIDTLGDAWVTNGSSAGGAVTELSSSGSVTASYAVGYGVGLAIDGSNNIWVPGCSSNKTCEFNGANGTAVNGSPISGGNQDGVESVAIDAAGNAWVPDTYNSMITMITSTGVATSYSDNTQAGYFGVAVDASGSIWSVDGSNGVTKLSNDGSTSVTYTGGGTHTPSSIAIDGTGNAWIYNLSAEAISEFSNSGTPLSGSGLGYTKLPSAQGIAIDGSGNLWLTNNYHVTQGSPSYTIVEFVGAASPVVTPLAAGVKKNMLGTRP